MLTGKPAAGRAKLPPPSGGFTGRPVNPAPAATGWPGARAGGSRQVRRHPDRGRGRGGDRRRLARGTPPTTSSTWRRCRTAARASSTCCTRRWAASCSRSRCADPFGDADARRPCCVVGDTAYVESAQACGLHLTGGERRRGAPRRTASASWCSPRVDAGRPPGRGRAGRQRHQRRRRRAAGRARRHRRRAPRRRAGRPRRGHRRRRRRRRRAARPASTWSRPATWTTR